MISPPLKNETPVFLGSPHKMGLPEKFQSWRPNQQKAIGSILNCKTRFLAQAQPTGSGKSLTYVAATQLGHLKTKRVCIVTASKALQDQIWADFAVLGMQDIRGQGNYPCKLYPSLTVTDGPCKVGYDCEHRTNGCEYFEAYFAALTSRLVVTNYAYWLTMGRCSREDEDSGEMVPGLGFFDMVIFDEGHEAPQILLDFYTVEFDAKKFRETTGWDFPDHKQNMEEWIRWVKLTIDKVRHMMKGITNRSSAHTTLMKGISEWRKLEQKLAWLASGIGSGWKYTRDGDAVKFGIVDTHKGWAEKHLFQGVPYVVLTSATIREKTMNMLGLTPAYYTFEEYESNFPQENSPVYIIPTLKMNRATDERDFISTMITQIDRIVSQRVDRNGLIHTGSYDRQRLLKEHSRMKSMMLFPTKYTAKDLIAEFKSLRQPRVIASPALVAGYDFPGRECEYIIFLKLPFPSFGDQLFVERTKRDGGLSNYIVGQNLVQGCGRGMRSESDRCEIFILDSSWEWWYKQNIENLPRWFARCIKQQRTLPQAPLPISALGNGTTQ